MSTLLPRQVRCNQERTWLTSLSRPIQPHSKRSRYNVPPAVWRKLLGRQHADSRFTSASATRIQHASKATVERWIATVDGIRTLDACLCHCFELRLEGMRMARYEAVLKYASAVSMRRTHVRKAIHSAHIATDGGHEWLLAVSLRPRCINRCRPRRILHQMRAILAYNSSCNTASAESGAGSPESGVLSVNGTAVTTYNHNMSPADRAKWRIQEIFVEIWNKYPVIFLPIPLIHSLHAAVFSASPSNPVPSIF